MATEEEIKRAQNLLCYMNKQSAASVLYNSGVKSEDCVLAIVAAEILMKNGGEVVLPEDYEACGYCGYDHEYEFEESVVWHTKNDPDNSLYN